MVAVPEDLQRNLDSAYRAHFPQLYRRARRWLPADEAEDLVQETFLRAWRHHGGRDPGIAWLMTVLRNLAIDKSRRIKPDLVEDIATVERETADDTADTVVALDDRRRIRDAVRSLTESQQKALHMKEWMGFSQEEIAESLGTTVPAVESLLLRGRRRLRVMLEGALGVAVWPITFVWRRFRVPEQVLTSGAGQTGVTAWGGTMASVATAAVIAVGSITGASGPADQGDRDRSFFAAATGDRASSTEFGSDTFFEGGGGGSSHVPSGGIAGADSAPAVDAPAAGGDTGVSAPAPDAGVPAPTDPAADVPGDSGGSGDTTAPPTGGDTGAGSGSGSEAPSSEPAPPPPSDGSGSTSGSGATPPSTTGSDDPTGSGDTGTVPPSSGEEPEKGSGTGGDTSPPPSSSGDGNVPSGDTGSTGGDTGGTGSSGTGSEEPDPGGSTGSTGGDTGSTGGDGGGTGGDGGDIGLGGF